MILLFLFFSIAYLTQYLINAILEGNKGRAIMSKSGKIRKNILKQFKDFSDEEILYLLQNAISEYIKLTESKKIAREILIKYNRPVRKGFCLF